MLEERQYVEAGLRSAIDAYEARIAELECRLDEYEPDAKSDGVHYKYDGKCPHDVRGWQP